MMQNLQSILEWIGLIPIMVLVSWLLYCTIQFIKTAINLMNSIIAHLQSVKNVNHNWCKPIDLNIHLTKDKELY